MKPEKTEFSYPFHGRDFRDLKGLSRVYSIPGVMALWDEYIDQDNEFNARTGYSIYQFCRQMPFLVDSHYWKAKKIVYEKLMSRQENNDLMNLVKSLIPPEMPEFQPKMRFAERKGS
jgi:hypothetical protein